jgi:hypothetical protein
MDVQGGVDQVRIEPRPVPSPGPLSTGNSLARLFFNTLQVTATGIPSAARSVTSG